MTTETEWEPAPGDNVVTWRGNDLDEPSRVMTIDRVTATQIIINGQRWRKDTLRLVGDHGYYTPSLYRADDPRITEAAKRRAARVERSKVANRLQSAAEWWANHHQDEKRTAELREAIIAIAPHLGLTVTDGADLCQYVEDGKPCLLDKDHADRGEWHTGLGWRASLGTPTTDH